MSKSNIEIPMDVYESVDELVIVIPLGGTSKDSVEVLLQKTHLTIKGLRQRPQLKENLMPLQEESYWGSFEKTIDLPKNVYFDKIHTKLTSENILIVVIPKVRIPDKVQLQIESN